MKLPKYLFPFAGKKKLSGTEMAMHLAVYGALIWIVLRSLRIHKKENFIAPVPIVIASRSYANMSAGSFLLTQYTDTLFRVYGESFRNYITPVGALYQINISNGTIATTPIKISSILTYKTNTPPLYSPNEDAGTAFVPPSNIGFYLYPMKYTITFADPTIPVIVLDRSNWRELDNYHINAIGFYPRSKTYNNVWLDTITMNDGTKIPVVLDLIYNSSDLPVEDFTKKTPSVIPSSTPLPDPSTLPKVDYSSENNIQPPLEIDTTISANRYFTPPNAMNFAPSYNRVPYTGYSDPSTWDAPHNPLPINVEPVIPPVTKEGVDTTGTSTTEGGISLNAKDPEPSYLVPVLEGLAIGVGIPFLIYGIYYFTIPRAPVKATIKNVIPL